MYDTIIKINDANDASCAEGISARPKVLIEDLGGSALASFSGVSYHRSYHYLFIEQPFDNAPVGADGLPMNPKGPVPPDKRYLIRATDHLMGRMKTTFFTMPLPEGDRIKALHYDDRKASFTKYAHKHLIRNDYFYGANFASEVGEPLVAPVDGYLAAFWAEDWDCSRNYELLVQHRQPTDQRKKALNRYVVRATWSDCYGGSETAFYEVPGHQGDSLLAEPSEQCRAQELCGLAQLHRGEMYLPKVDRWRLLLGWDILHADVTEVGHRF